MDIYGYLEQCGVAFSRHEHPAVYTVADTRRQVPPLPGAAVKNLFLRDAKGVRHFLVAVGAASRVDLKGLAGVLGVGRLSFGSPRRLQTHLGVEPGAVSVLAVVRDAAGTVEVVIDRDLWGADAFQFHPLVNTCTLVIPREGLQRFLECCRHPPRLVDIPTR